MDRDRFESEVVTLAATGKLVTVANVAARTGVPPRKAEAMLDAMVHDGFLESDVDEREAVVVYKVRGLTAASAPSLGSIDAKVEARVRELERASARALAAPPEGRARGDRSAVLGAALGLVFGPLGLAYSAPWGVVLVTTLAYGLASSLPFVRAVFALVVALVHLGFAIAGGLYARRYNQLGRRAPLLPPERRPGLPPRR